MTQDERRRSIWYLVNEESDSEKYLSPATIQTLENIFRGMYRNRLRWHTLEALMTGLLIVANLLR